MTKSCGYGGLKLHGLTGYWMVETQEPGMQAQAMQGIITIAVFGIATDRMSHISSMHTNLILTTGLQLKLYQ